MSDRLMDNNPFESPQTQGRSQQVAQPDKALPSPRSYRIGRRLILAYYISFFVLFPFMFVNSIVQMANTSDAQAFEILESITLIIAFITVLAMFGALFAFFWAASWIIRTRKSIRQALLEIYRFYAFLVFPPFGLFRYDRLFNPKHSETDYKTPQAPLKPDKASAGLRMTNSPIKWIL